MPPTAHRPPPLSFLQFEIRQLRAHLAQQDLDLAAEREAALQAPHVLSQPRSRYKVVEAGTWAEELQPAQGESAGASPRALRTATASGSWSTSPDGSVSRCRSTILVVVMGEP